MQKALLIDAENVGAVFWPQIKGAVSRKLGAKKVFADFGAGHCKQWLAVAEEDGLTPVPRPGGSNATDIAITIAAMDLLRTGDFDTIYLVSSDRDYVPLVQRLRKAKLKVVVIGEAKTVQSARNACSEFVELKPVKATPTTKAA